MAPSHHLSFKTFTRKTLSLDKQAKPLQPFPGQQSCKDTLLDNELHTITLENMSINEYCNKNKTMAELLAKIDKAAPDSNLVTITVNGLPRRGNE